MPAPSIIDICSRSFTSLHNQIQSRVQQIIHSYSKTEGDYISPYLSWIQSLTGSTPGQKQRSLNALIASIAETPRAYVDLTSAIGVLVPGVSPTVLAVIRVRVALKLKLDEHIIESLKSTDSRVVKRALTAHWIFAGSNVKSNAANFVENVIPYVSLRTRCGVIKKLATGLRGYPEKAQVFFDRFVELYGTEASLPILLSCSESFIYERILAHKIVLPLKTVSVLYDRYPELVVRYLQLGNPRRQDNAEDRKILQVTINDYDTILPKLIKRHPRVFVELYEITPEKSLRLSNNRTWRFLKHLRRVLIDKSHVFLKILSPRVVSRALKREEFDKMFENLLPRDRHEINVKQLLEQIEYYPHDGKLQLLKSSYEKVYKKDLLSDRIFAEEPTFWKLLPTEERETLAKNCYDAIDEEKRADFLFYLPPRDSVPALREKVKAANEARERFEYIGQMLQSCSLHESKQDLLLVLSYYYEEHKNERDLYVLFEKLSGSFDLRSLDDEHWIVLQKIIHNAHVRGELFRQKVSLVKSVLETALHHLLVVRREPDVDGASLSKLFEIMVESGFETLTSDWNVLKEHAILEKRCLLQFLQLIPEMYPLSHEFWSDKDNRLSMLLSLAKSVHNFNTRLRAESIASARIEPIRVEEFGWLTKLSDDFFSRAYRSGFRKSLLLHLLRVEAPDFYFAKVGECFTILDIDDLNEALNLLRRYPRIILASWPDYLTEARSKIVSEKKRERRLARTFVAATRWCHELPTKFIERCLLEIKEKGSIQVLGVLLDGEAFEKLVEPYLPSEASETDETDPKKSFEISRSVAVSARYPEPPVSLNFILNFTESGEYPPEIGETAESLSYRHSVKDVLGLADELLGGQSVATKKFGVRLIFRCLRRDRQTNIAQMLCKTETNTSVSDVLADRILDMFAKSPNDDNWRLVKDCIERLSANSQVVEKFADLERVGVDRRFLGDYVEAYLNKIESIYRAEAYSHSYSLVRTKCVCLVILNLDPGRTDELSEDVSRTILNRYFLDHHSEDISQAVQSFALRSYLLASSNATFKARLKVITDILRKIVERLDKSDPKKPRFYPANYTLTEFYADALTEIAARRPDESFDMIDQMLEVFNGELSPWQLSRAYLSYNLYKEYLLASGITDFGSRCGNRTASLIEELSGSDFMIADVAECLDKFLAEGKIYPESGRYDLKLELIEGLLRVGDRYGLLVGTLLLSSAEVRHYDERYDKIVKKIRAKKSKSIQYSLHKHIGEIKMKL